MTRFRSAAPAAALLAVAACGGMNDASGVDPNLQVAAGAAADDARLPRTGRFTRRDLVSDGAVPAAHTDANLRNAWGLDARATTPWWVADNAAGVSTLYDAQGVAQPPASPLVVTIPGAGGQPGAPTGLVANDTADFSITMGGATGPAFFLFAGEDGTISAWMRTTPIVPTAVMKVDESGANAVFKGLAMAATPAGTRLYATDFHNGRVRVYDGRFQAVTLPRGAFTDPHLPAGFAPFGIRAVHGLILVTYALQDADAHDDVAGPGNGFVDAYSTAGRLLARLASRGKLDSPWGLALAPGDFGRHSFRLLVGNFGDGHVVSFGLHHQDGRERGEQRDDLDDDGVLLQDASGPITIPKLWGLAFANGGPSGPTNALFFTAGPDDETDGLFGRIDAAAP